MSRTHAFVICAYKKSPYLEFCMRSLRRQSVKSDVYLVTSTPSEYIDRLAEKYRIPVFVREGKSSLKEDWLFGWRLAGADHSLVTIAHQDDKYHPRYVEELLKAYEIGELYISGDGETVTEQFPEAGEEVKKNTALILHMK